MNKWKAKESEICLNAGENIMFEMEVFMIRLQKTKPTL